MIPTTLSVLALVVLASQPGTADKPAPRATPKADPGAVPATQPATATPVGAGTLSIEKTGVDFGKIDDTALPKAEIPFQNTGKDTLIFTGLRPSCGCVRPELKGGKRDYAPGESGILVIGFEPRGKKGKSEFNVVITTNDSANPSLIFKVEATIKPSIGSLPIEGVNLDKLDYGVEKATTFYVFARDATFKPTFATVSGERPFGVTVGAVEPFDLDGDKVYRAPVHLTVPADTKLGRFAEKIYIRHNLEQFSAGIETVALQGEVMHDLRPDVTEIKSATQAEGAYSGEFTLTNSKGIDFKVTKSSYMLRFGPGVTCNATFEPTGTPGQYKVKYQGKGGVKPGENRGWLVIEHDLADMPPLRIVVKNIVQPKAAAGDGTPAGDPAKPAAPAGDAAQPK